MTFDGLGGSSSIMMFSEGSESTPLAEIYGAFARSQTPSETRIGARVAAEGLCGSLISKEAKSSRLPDFGETKPEATRILLRGIGEPDYDLVAVGTTQDFVAVSLFPDGSASCGNPSFEGIVLSAQQDKHDAIVFGLVEDGVDSIDFVVDGVTSPARLGENGFAGEIRDPVGKTLDKIVLHDEDGSVTEFPPD
jgi:hypothetical protein